MSRNIWIGVVVVVVLVAGGWWYFRQSVMPATLETTQLPTAQQNNTNGIQQIPTNSLPTQQPAQSQIVSGILRFHYTPYEDEDVYSSQTTFIPRDEAPRVNNPGSQNMIKFRNYQNLLTQVGLEPPNRPGTCGWAIDATVEIANRKWKSASSNVSVADLVRFMSKDSQQVTCIP